MKTKIINIVHVYLIFIFTLLFEGCSFLNLFMPPDNQRWINEYKHDQAWEQHEENLFAPYLGQTFNEVRNAFGKPKKITNVNSSAHTHLKVEPYVIWEYGALSVGKGEKYNFFFRNGKLSEVDVLK